MSAIRWRNSIFANIADDHDYDTSTGEPMVVLKRYSQVSNCHLFLQPLFKCSCSSLEMNVIEENVFIIHTVSLFTVFKLHMFLRNVCLSAFHLLATACIRECACVLPPRWALPNSACICFQSCARHELLRKPLTRQYVVFCARPGQAK